MASPTCPRCRRSSWLPAPSPKPSPTRPRSRSPKRQDHRDRRPAGGASRRCGRRVFASRGDSFEIRESRRPGDADAAAYAEGAALPNPARSSPARASRSGWRPPKRRLPSPLPRSRALPRRPRRRSPSPSLVARLVAFAICSSISTHRARSLRPALVEGLPEILQVAPRDATGQVSGQAARAGADDRGAEDGGREQDPDQRPDPDPVQAPCWVGFSVFVTRTLPSSSFRITAESNVPIAPAAWRSNTAS